MSKDIKTKFTNSSKKCESRHYFVWNKITNVSLKNLLSKFSLEGN